MLANTLFDSRVERLHDIAARVSQALENAGIPYRVVGGYATFIYVDESEPINARLTADVDIAVARTDLARIADAVAKCGLKYRHAAGIDMLVDAKEPKARTAVHLIFVCEKVRPEYVESVPDFGKESRHRGLLLAPVEDLVRMKLTSFRLKDRVHIQDLDSVGLITPAIEATLSDVLRARLAEVRASE